jgi:uncharacterized protein YbjQ (UPF0145 family)
MKLKFTMTACVLALAAQAAMAGTVLHSFPLKPVLDAQPGGNDVALYFGSQPHPEATSQLGEEAKSGRVARSTDDEQTACNRALTQALTDLRTYARDHHANAVINIRTSFHSTETASDTDFTCATSWSAAALKVRGDLVTLPAQ